jgi:hypothetical protein
VSGLAPLAVSFNSAGSSDPDGDALTYAWAFGDGAGASGPTATHVYSSAGDYTASLSAADGYGASATANIGIHAIGFPATAVLDDFNRADGALAIPWAGSLGGLAVRSGALAQIANGSPSAVWNSAAFGPGQEAYVTLAAITTSPEHDLLLKCQGTSWSAGAIQVRYDSKQKKITVSTCTSTSGWKARGAIAQTLAAGDQFGARAFANGDVEVYRNGAKLGTISVSGWVYAAKGGRVGFSLVNATSSRLDGFGGGTLPTPAPAPAMSVKFPVQTAEIAAPIRTQSVSLSPAFPDPSAGSVHLVLALPRSARVRWAIYDIQGRSVWSETRDLEAGPTTLTWLGHAVAGRESPSGVYVASVELDGRRLIRRFALLR